MFKKFLDMLFGNKDKPKKEAFKILGSDVKKILQNSAPKALIKIADANYKIYAYNDVVKFLADNLIDRRQYIPEIHDCDDFALALMAMARWHMKGIPFGEVWLTQPSGGHAVNFFIDENTQFWLVEPQTDEISRVKETQKIFFLKV